MYKVLFFASLLCQSFSVFFPPIRTKAFSVFSDVLLLCSHTRRQKACEQKRCSFLSFPIWFSFLFFHTFKVQCLDFIAIDSESDVSPSQGPFWVWSDAFFCVCVRVCVLGSSCILCCLTAQWHECTSAALLPQSQLVQKIKKNKSVKKIKSCRDFLHHQSGNKDGRITPYPNTLTHRLIISLTQKLQSAAFLMWCVHWQH